MRRPSHLRSVRFYRLPVFAAPAISSREPHYCIFHLHISSARSCYLSPVFVATTRSPLNLSLSLCMCEAFQLLINIAAVPNYLRASRLAALLGVRSRSSAACFSLCMPTLPGCCVLQLAPPRGAGSSSFSCFLSVWPAAAASLSVSRTLLAPPSFFSSHTTCAPAHHSTVVPTVSRWKMYAVAKPPSPQSIARIAGSAAVGGTPSGVEYEES